MLTLPAILTHNAAAGFEGGVAALVQTQPAEVAVDAGALKDFDSSALAVLLACRREALAAGKTFSVRDLPAGLRQLAGLYGVAELIPASV